MEHPRTATPITIVAIEQPTKFELAVNLKTAVGVMLLRLLQVGFGTSQRYDKLSLAMLSLG